MRYHPAVVAQAFATLGLLHPGRRILGVGAGEALNESVLEIHFLPAAERFARLREAIRVIRLLWSEERVNFEGAFYNLVNSTIHDRPTVRIPIYVAGGGPGVTNYAGWSADGYICTSGKGMDLYRETLLPDLEDGLAAGKRSRLQID